MYLSVQETNSSARNSLKLADKDSATLQGRVCWFARAAGKGVTEKGIESEISTGVVVGSAVEAFHALLTELYLPALASQECSRHWTQQQIAETLQVIESRFIERS